MCVCDKMSVGLESMHVGMCVSVYVCVCVREREKGREGERERGREGERV